MLIEKYLILRFKQRRPEALRKIYDMYKVDLLKLAVVLTNDISTAEDVVQDVFVGFAQSVDRIKIRGSLKSYLITSIINRVRNIRRDVGRQRLEPLQAAGSVIESRRGPLQWAVLGEQLSQLSQALQQLPYEQREVICCRMELDMTFNKIAQSQGVSLNTVKGRYRYGLNKLRSLLNGEIER